MRSRLRALMCCLLLTFILAAAVPALAAPTTYYVRTGGGTTAQCTGTTNADYPGAGTAQACAYSNLQHAIDKATFGDTIKLRAGQTFTVPGLWYSFYLKNKGTPPTGTDADYITITTDDPAGTPSALSGYPATPTRITTAMAVNMPKVQAIGAAPAFDFLKNSKYWKIERLNVTNVDSGAQTVMLFGQNDYAITAKSEYPDRIVIQQNWIHPVEETGAPLDATTVARSAESAIYLNATNVTVRQNAMQGFVGRYKYGGAAGQAIASANYLITAWADNVLIEHNLLEAWTYAFFAGGSSVPKHLVTGTGTVSACTPTSCVFSNTTGLVPGMPVAVYVSNAVPPRWGATFVQSISTSSTVTFTAPLCASYDGGNTCTGVKPAGVVPGNGNTARWDGDQPQNITLRRNIFAHDLSWATYLGRSSGKGYLEVKACVRCVFDGNIFTGATGATVTVRNQGGDFPWASLDGLTFSNNYFKNSNNTFLAFLTDSTPSRKSKGVTWTNNLMVGIGPVLWTGTTAQLAGTFYGGEQATISHNTVLWTQTYQNFVGYLKSPMTSLTIRDNIFGAGVNYCWDLTERGVVGMPQCWPSAAVDRNVLVNARGWSSGDLNGWWLTPFPNNTVVGSIADLGLVDFAGAEGGGDYHGYALAASSPFKSQASDGKDPGVDFAALDAAIFGTASPAPAPVPEPTPVPAPCTCPVGPMVATNYGVSTQNLAGPSSTPGPGGGLDLRIGLTGLRAGIKAVEITGPGGNRWGYNAPGWAVVLEPVAGDPTKVSGYFEPAAPSGTTGPFLVKVTYADGMTAEQVQAVAP